MSATTISNRQGEKNPRWVPPRCPAIGCEGTMRTADKRELNPQTGLERVTCPSCGHQGYVAAQGLHLLFKDGREYVFSYGPSLATLTVAFSCAVRARFATVPADDLAHAVAARALLMGRVDGVVDLSSQMTVTAGVGGLDVPPHRTR